MSDISMAHVRSFQNRDRLKRRTFCSCYFCIRTFKVSDIKFWTDHGETALCPNCDIDSILPGWWSVRRLKALHERWFCTKNAPVVEDIEGELLRAGQKGYDPFRLHTP
jgi:hypothetical protein